ncbi:OstA-like protein [Rubrivirga sp.]|uniref:OstA-like protein n=1 Tax=Rubrivirga sp. TaxID=1885344 RepID=UPI003B516B07
MTGLAALAGMGHGGRGTGRFGLLLRILSLASCLFPLAPEAQVRRVEILNADYVEVTTDTAGVVRRLVGDVRLRQDTTFLRSDRAVYYESRGEVVMDGAVRILSGRDTLTAAAVTYDSNTKTAVASGAVRLGDGESVVLAPTATYDSRAEIAAFTGGGRILHRGAVLTSAEGTYSSARRVAEFAGPVTLEDSSGVLTAARGTYDADVRRADFAGDVRLRRPDAALDADSVVYFRRTERARAYGRVVLQRVGDDGAVERAADAPADSSRRTLLFGETLLFDGQAETASARGEPGRDPLLLTLRADSTGRVDSTLARAPRIDAARLVVGADTSTVIVMGGGARVWERRLAAVADSARFVRQPGDSLRVDLDRLGLFGARRPSVWADGSQLTGDSLFASVRGGAVDSLRVLGRAFAARLDSTLGRLQQIAGGRMLGLFDDDDLRTLGVGPNAQVVYYRASPDGLLAGAEELSADTLAFRFEDGELRELAGYRGIQGTTYGATVVPDDPRLPGFAYTPDAPTRAALLGDGWEVGWLDQYGPALGLPPPDDGDPPPLPEDAPEATGE